MGKEGNYDLENVFKFKNNFKKYRVAIVLLVIVSSAALICSFWNTANIRKSSYESTEKFLNILQNGKVQTINDEKYYKTTKLRTLADSLEDFDIGNGKEQIEEFLERKKMLTDFDALVVFDTEKNCVSGYGDFKGKTLDLEKIREMRGLDEAFQGDAGVDHLKEHYLVYSVPVYVGEKAEYVLCGVSHQKSIASIEKVDNTFGENITCIIDSEGKEVFALQEKEQLEDRNGLSQKDEHEILGEVRRRIQKDGGMEKSSIFRTKTTGGEEVFVSCASLEMNDWHLLTIVPEDLFTGISKGYTLRMNLIIGMISLIFLGFFYVLHGTYEEGRKELSRRVFIDELTGGMNNTAFGMKFQGCFPDIEGSSYAVVLLDAKEFKLVNEKFGVKAGDDLLRCTYQTIQEHLCAQEKEFAARSELDHFFICMKEGTHENIQRRIDEIIEGINRVWEHTDANHPIRFRQAGYVIEEHQTDIRMIQDRVRTALQKQRFEASERCVFYDQEILERIKRNHQLESLFDASIANHDFEMYLQPKVELDSWRLKGAEALVRWKHPKEGMIFPSEFIPLFERDGKIQELDQYMFEETCRFIAKRKRAGMELFPISVNLSRDHFLTPNFLKKFVEIADKYSVPRDLIEFELTERLFLDGNSIRSVKEGMHEMHELGFHCSIDDFGTGYSSLGLLKEFEIDVLKIDRLFFEDLSDEKSKNIIKCVIQLAKTLNVQTVAEGIETLEQLDELKEIPCNLVQGYFFSKPLPVDGFEAWEKEFCKNEVE